jgi:ribosomal protein S18 acetylase RimI-like enzyme
MANQPHRAEVSKLLVHRRMRRQGLGEKLMREAEVAARDIGRPHLVLDTAKGDDAERLYTRLGWNRVGEIPDFAYDPVGALRTTVFFWKKA